MDNAPPHEFDGSAAQASGRNPDYRDLIDELIEISFRLTGHVDAQSMEALRGFAATFGGNGRPRMTADEASIALERISTTICDAIERATFAEPRAARASVGRYAKARKRIVREIEAAIKRCASPEEADALRAELREHIALPFFDEYIDEMPLTEIITNLRRDLGLDNTPGERPYWKRRTPADIVELHEMACGRGGSVQRTTPSAPARPPLRLVWPPTGHGGSGAPGT